MPIYAMISPDQPNLVCRDCGHQWGLWWDNGLYKGPAKHCSTFHQNKCDVCGETKAVTKASDYGYLAVGWNKDLLK